MINRETKIIAEIIAGTKTKKRRISLLTVADNLRFLYTKYNSLIKVAHSVDLSAEMVREFLKLTELTKEVKKIIQKGHINSVDIGYRISKLSESDQIILAQAIIGKKLLSEDVRKIVKYKIDNLNIPMRTVIKRVLEAKDRIHFVAYFRIDNRTMLKLKNKTNNIICNLFSKIIDKKCLVSCVLKGKVIIVKVTAEGRKLLIQKAKSLKISLAKLGNTLVDKYI